MEKISKKELSIKQDKVFKCMIYSLISIGVCILAPIVINTFILVLEIILTLPFYKKFSMLVYKIDNYTDILMRAIRIISFIPISISIILFILLAVKHNSLYTKTKNQ